MADGWLERVANSFGVGLVSDAVEKLPEPKVHGCMTLKVEEEGEHIGDVYYQKWSIPKFCLVGDTYEFVEVSRLRQTKKVESQDSDFIP